jgi:hypothetical protein
MRIKVNKAEILVTIRANREAHKKIFAEAVEGYKKKAMEVLEQHIAEVKAGKFFTYIQLTLPSDHSRDYDRVIKMLEQHQGTEIELIEADYAMYVLDDWQWKRQFLVSNSQYSGTAAAALASEQEQE